MIRLANSNCFLTTAMGEIDIDTDTDSHFSGSGGSGLVS